jgi:hypothetical protein
MKRCLAVFLLSLVSGLCTAQEPTTPINKFPKLSLVPLVIVNIGSGEIAFPVSSPTGAPRPLPEFFLPRNGSKEITVTTSGGNVKVNFSNSVPPGVTATAFQWQQSSVPAGNAVGRLEYSGCASCPASFTLEVTAASNDIVHASAKITLTASTGRPAVSSITANGGDNIEPRFEVRFQRGTFDPSDSQIVGTYASGLKYRLIPDSNSQFTDGRMNVIVPRLEVDRTVRVALVNPYGSSGNTNVTLPQEGIIENPVFEQVNASGEFPNPASIGDTFSVKHTNNGLLDVSGTDDITIKPLTAASACNQRDYIFQSARVSWLGGEIHVTSSGSVTSQVPDQPVTTPGPITIASQPPTNALLRSPNNKIRVNWTLKARFGDVFYQVLYRGVEVVGLCNDRVIH